MSEAPPRFVVDQATQAAQRGAADPAASAWVSANAGAGKTKVLTDRVVRLLLAGTPPGRILCLTFTKAAAANMSTRVFERLGRWVTEGDAALAADLEGLTGKAPSREGLDDARRLFARAVETPGGLKIETLHALCERLLHMFPFEANVPAGFCVLDDDAAAAMFARETDATLADAVLGAAPDIFAAHALIQPDAQDDTLRDLIRGAMRARAVLRQDGLSAPFAALGTALGLRAGEDEAEIAGRILSGLPGLKALAGRLRTGAATDEGLADALVRADPAAPPEAVEALRGAFFTDKGDPRKNLGTKAAGPEVKAALLAERDRLVPLFESLGAARALARTRALFTLAAEIDRRVEARKARIGALDFDDLIHKTRDLLARVDAAWVLYKLDRGIDHVLIDEAQDTNPEQWAILDSLTAEFTAGAGAREVRRTRFAVGDPKQSIYSFQGAEPRRFEETRREWLRASKTAGLAFEDVSLRLSFRSARGILRAVDATFAIPEHFGGLSFADEAVGTVHASARGDAPGIVELWPIAEPQAAAEPDAWTAPVDAPETSAPAIVTARKVARAVRRWIDVGDEGGRRRRPGEILLLVRKRGAAFEEAIRALKALGVPVAGQDRLDVAAHIAVMDLVAIGRAGLLPADDLTLATALKTPLVGLSDDDLVRLSGGRAESETLEDALGRHAEAGDRAAILARAALSGWIALAARQGPFGFYATLLGPGGGREKLVARLGGEAGDAIDVFLAKAAEAESGTDAPSLSGFIGGFEARGTEGLTVKRDLETGHDEVRVMTVHGAKGLEAPVVVLLDGCEPLGRNDPKLLAMGADGAVPLPPVWAGAKTQDSPATAAARDRIQARSREEHNRLLYVAMTRAADRLVVAPYRGATKETAGCWCEMIRIGLEASGWPGEAVELPYGPATLWRDGVAAASAPSDAAAPPSDAAVPSWLHAPAPVEAAPPPPLSPSGALRAADSRPPPARRQADGDARRRGVLVHALLEHLPRLDPARRGQAADAFVHARAPAMPKPKQAAIVEAALRLIDEPELAPLFSAGARAEVTLSGKVVVEGVERAVYGRVDRLSVEEGVVRLADFKTGRPPVADAPLPVAEAGQLALYALLLARIYPGRNVVPMLVWTSGPTIRRLSEAEIAAALAPLGL
ncbi:double-strand break repair helicase AddA [Methylobacterium sp. sgz302541]|uniref:double-strand break repair helicase AddA n=1 Tax=unclassified Methylobacterium TaxID=2615210 RepID=UPI003D331415